MFPVFSCETDILDQRHVTEGFINIINKKFWEGLIVYFPLIRQGPYRKRHVQHLFVAAGMSLLSFRLSTIGKYTDRCTDARVSQFINNGSGFQRLIRRFTCTQTAWKSHKPTSIFFSI
jgi:hypothetical protein